MISRSNLITNNPSFTSTTGWTAFTSGTLSVITTDYAVGTSSLKIVKTSTTLDSGVVASGITYFPTYTASSVYSASAYIKVPTGQESGDFRVAIRFYDGSGTFVSVLNGPLITITDADGWVRVTADNLTAPATGSTNMSIVVYQDAGNKTIGNYYLVDAVKIENSPITTGYYIDVDQGQENKKVNIALSPLPIPHITGMKLRADIMLNNIVFNTIDETNVVWVCTDIQGWWDLPDSEVPDLTRGLDDGSYDVRGRYTNRNLTFTGSILAPDADTAAAARNKLIKAIDLIHSGAWLLVDESPTKAAYVRVSGKPEITSINARGRIDFSIGLRSADPVKYKWTWTNPDGYETGTVLNDSSSVLVNYGNTDVPITFTISGGATTALTAPITINNTTTGKTLTIVKSLRAANYSINITASARTGNVVTLTTSGHSFYVGDSVAISGVTTSGRTTLNETARILTDVTATTLTYVSATATPDLTSATTNGAITLTAADTLVVDTYNKSVLKNGSSTAARSYIDALVDWIVLQPGNNTITFTDSGGTTDMTIKYRSGWIG